jgi:hypothetical protein
VTSLLAAVLFACALCAPPRAAADDDDAPADTTPAAAAPSPLRPEIVVAGDTNSDSAKVFRAKGGPARAVVHGGAVIINADGSRLEIAPTKRPASESLALASPSLLANLKLPALPTLDDPKESLSERARRAKYLLGGSVAAALFLIFWARHRWRHDV